MSSTNNDAQMRAALREKLEFLAQPVDGEGRDIGWWQTLAAMQQTEAKDCLSLLASQPVAAEPFATAEAIIQQAIDSAPEPLRRLGEFLTRVLDEDQWKTAERMLLGAATAQTPAPVVQETRQWWDWQGICDAYEGGVGHGRQRRTLSNPYVEGSDGFHAYAYGVEQGNLQQDRADASKADVCTWTSGDGT